MKTFIALLALGFSTLTFACTDLSGTYQDQESGSNYQVTQSGCSSVNFTLQDMEMVITVDGKFHEVMNLEITTEDGSHASIILSASANFVGSELLMDMKTRTEFDGKVEIEESKSVTSLTAEGDITTTTTSEDGTVETTVDKRVK
jgi:hypothetical protein